MFAVELESAPIPEHSLAHCCGHEPEALGRQLGEEGYGVRRQRCQPRLVLRS